LAGFKKTLPITDYKLGNSSAYEMLTDVKNGYAKIAILTKLCDNFS